MSAGTSHTVELGKVPGATPVFELVLIELIKAQLSADRHLRNAVATLLASECLTTVIPVSQAWKQYTSAGSVPPFGNKPPGSLRSSIYTRKTNQRSGWLLPLAPQSAGEKTPSPVKMIALAGAGRGSGPQIL